MFDSLRLYSFFQKEIIVTKKHRLPAETMQLIDQIDNDGAVAGQIFRPTPDGSKIMTVVMGIFVFMFMILVVQGLSLEYLLTKGDWWAIPAIVTVFFMLLYYSFFIYWIGPWWVKHHIHDYFIYIGPEGIIRKDRKKISIVPWDIVTGVQAVFGVRGAGHYVEIEIRGRALFSPLLIRGTEMTTVFVDWIEYGPSDMQEIQDVAQRYL